MKSGGSLIGFGALLVAVAVGIVIYQRQQPDKVRAASSSGTQNTTTGRARDRVAGTPAERLERMRGVLFEKRNKDLKEEDFRLMKSLPAESLMMLMDEFAKAPERNEEQSFMVIEMLKRLGEIEETTALEWVMSRGNNWIWRIPRDYMIRQVLVGWAERDAPAAFAKVLDPEFRYSCAERGSNAFGGIDKPPPQLVTKATAEDPEGTWRVLCKNRRNELGGQFFAALDPAVAKIYALRLSELFIDPDKPGLELFGGLESDTTSTRTADRYLSAAKAAAGGWFVKEPEAALAWYLKESPALEKSEEEFGEKAGDLIGRWVKEEPEKALEWVRSKSPGMRVGLADEVASTITFNRTYSEEDMSRLNEAFGWMDGKRRIQWLTDTAKLQRWHAAYRDVSTSPAEQILAGLKMSPQEKASLEQVLAREGAR